MKEKRIGLSISSNSGVVRQNNEDSFSVNGKPRPMNRNNINICGNITSDRLSLLAVFDGMGGEEMGEVASDIGAQFCGKLMEKLDCAEPEEYTELVNNYVNAANHEICKRLGSNESKRGGTTFALVYIKDGMVYPYSLGDSRIYVYRDGELTQISEDHTLAMRKYKANIYTLEEAKHSKDSHKLTLFLGVDVDGDGLSAASYTPFALPERGKLLLCSDGLYDMCEDEEIAQILSRPAENHALKLVDAAIGHGGIDNTTCIVADLG